MAPLHSVQNDLSSVCLSGLAVRQMGTFCCFVCFLSFLGGRWILVAANLFLLPWPRSALCAGHGSLPPLLFPGHILLLSTSDRTSRNFVCSIGRLCGLQVSMKRRYNVCSVCYTTPLWTRLWTPFTSSVLDEDIYHFVLGCPYNAYLWLELVQLFSLSAVFSLSSPPRCPHLLLGASVLCHLDLPLPLYLGPKSPLGSLGALW